MAKRAVAPAVASPTEAALVAATPSPATVAAPEVKGFFDRYRALVAPLETFQVTDNASYIQAGQAFTQLSAYIAEIEAAFDEPTNLLYRAHRAMTGLRGMFTNPATAVKDNLAQQQLAWKAKLDADRLAEESRLQAIENERVRREHQELVAAELERQRLDRVAAEANTMPWEDSAGVPEPPAPPPMPEPPPVPMVRLPSTLPYVAGQTVRSTPWKARVDLKALVAAAAKDDNLLQYLEAKMPLINATARDHGECISEIIPGVTAYKEEILARG